MTDFPPFRCVALCHQSVGSKTWKICVLRADWENDRFVVEWSEDTPYEGHHHTSRDFREIDDRASEIAKEMGLEKPGGLDGSTKPMHFWALRIRNALRTK